MADMTFDGRIVAAAASGDMGAAAAMRMAPPPGPVDKRRISEALDTLRRYMRGKEQHDLRIIENERWYKLRHWEFVKSSTSKDAQKEPRPASAWLFNALAGKHADMMDNIPEPVVLPRERQDEPDAEMLSSIIPVILERNDFEDVYDRAAWYKLKHGTAAWGVFWDSSKENGLGDIKIAKLNLLNVFWEPGVTDIQDSRNLFILQPADRDALKAQYPWAQEGVSTTLTPKDYIHDENVDMSNKAVVVDWYYRVRAGGRTVLHFAKFVGETLLYATENDGALRERGLYDHGMYPVFLDVLFPEEDMPTGFGYVDIIKEPQIYIDRLDQIIMKNALMSGKKRFFISIDAGVNEEEYADWDKDFVHVSGSLDERKIREDVLKPLDSFIITHKQMKIDELKETSGNRDFSQGSTSGGVTAAAAIAALQEAGNKLSRDLIKGSYRTFTKMMYMVIELVRQFYDEPRAFRIVGQDAAVRYVMYSNERLKTRAIPPAYPGAGHGYRRPIFDVKVRAQKSNPFSRAAQNELAKELYSMGFFDPARADMALAALDMMDFEGKRQVVQNIMRNGGMYRQMQQLAALLRQLAGAGEAAKDAQGSASPGAAGEQRQGRPPPDGAHASGKEASRASEAAAANAATPYAQRIAERARPDVAAQTGVLLH